MAPQRAIQLSPTTTLELKLANIVDNTDVEAIVNAANENLQLGGGVAGAIRNADDGTVQRECNAIGLTPTGQAALTSAGKLTKDKLKHVIHAVGPVYNAGRHDECSQLLRDAYTSTLALAEKNGIRSLAFPFLSSAIFGFHADKGSSKIAFKAVEAYVKAHPDAFDTIRFVSLTETAPFTAFEAELDLR